MAQSPGEMLSQPLNRLFALLIVLMFSAFQASASIECKFNTGSTQTIGGIIGGTSMLTPLKSVSSPTKISAPYPLSLSPGLESVCSVGDDGENIFMLVRTNLLVGSVENKGLFKTNVPGIAYTLAFRTVDNTATAYFPPYDINWVLTLHMDNHDELLKNRWWQAVIEFYQLPDFAGIPASVVSIAPAGGTIGRITIGDPNANDNDHPIPFVSMAENSFSVPVQKPTCTFTAPKAVNLGEYNISDVENDKTSAVTFAVNGNCNNTRKIIMKLTTSKTTGSGDPLLANTATSNAAKGVGVMLKWPDNSKVIPNAASNSYTAFEGSTITLFSRSLTAQLVKSGSEKVTSGQFSAIGTLQFTYE